MDDSGAALATVSRGAIDRDFRNDDDKPESAFYLYKLIVARSAAGRSLVPESLTGLAVLLRWRGATGFVSTPGARTRDCTPTTSAWGSSMSGQRRRHTVDPDGLPLTALEFPRPNFYLVVVGQVSAGEGVGRGGLASRYAA